MTEGMEVARHTVISYPALRLGQRVKVCTLKRWAIEKSKGKCTARDIGGALYQYTQDRVLLDKVDIDRRSPGSRKTFRYVSLNPTLLPKKGEEQ
ncbi:MAG: hypothetical protein WCR85_00275 [Sphaerochaeta sp.]